MDFQILLTNLTNPTLLFFVLGVIAVLVRSDLEVPNASIRFISLYLLFSIGFRGGHELAISGFCKEVWLTLLFGVMCAVIVPVYAFFPLKRVFSTADAGAISAAYGSVSAVTFVAASSFLESKQIAYGGHMVAVMAAMESPAIIVGVVLMLLFDPSSREKTSLKKVLHHSFTSGSVLMIIGSLVIGLFADNKQAEGIRPFTTDIFKGFLAIFLLEMGMVTARRFSAFKKYGWTAIAFAIFIPAFNGIVVAILSGLVTDSVGNRLLLAMLAASASYIAVPAAMQIAAPKADPGLYIPMALGVTFPFNITLGMPLYLWIITRNLL